MMISRDYLAKSIQDALRETPVAALLGARQVGKTTLARQLAATWPEPVHVFDMEDATDSLALRNPKQALAGLTGLVIIDEVQRAPHLFTALRPLVDRMPLPARFCLLGSAAPEIIRGVSESLAGRVSFVPVTGLTLDEVGAGRRDDLWLRGGFPRSFLASSSSASLAWRRDFIRTHVERDVPALGIRVQAGVLHRFWSMLAHYHGQVWNGEELGRSLGVTGKTVRHYLEILEGTYLVRVLPPWFENAGKRIVKSPKVYLRDSGLLHAFWGVESMRGLLGHPKYGASWEGFAMEQILARMPAAQPYFWATRQGAELDLFLERDGRRTGVEFKCADAPDMTKSMRIAMADLGLDRLLVVYPGGRIYALQENVTVMPLMEAVQRLEAAE
jgi:predicted AAA+ superfamily ATPase